MNAKLRIAAERLAAETRVVSENAKRRRWWFSGHSDRHYFWLDDWAGNRLREALANWDRTFEEQRVDDRIAEIAREVCKTQKADRGKRR